ncbi:MAG: GTP pyrophosphokinase [Candidatus Saganbacteria bacterium]|uniref:GTP pyrophosphokinase n=1 Tax=Candidatus Saganbacteria bacterium TaxID=2575572 RepID=A0A833P3D2_UNCSA|nr:MAG: GTP pyrophosphokinase [Candidatus Saganbacteria bacterium]
MLTINLTRVLIQKSGKTFIVPTGRDFFIRELRKSVFANRIYSLANKLKAASPIFNRERFFEAAGLCVYAHRNQFRKFNNSPYADHPITLAEKEFEVLHVVDEDELIAGLLHDTVEDTEIDLSFIEDKFGGAVAGLVDGLTKIKQFENDRLINEENINKFLQALLKDIRTLRLKMTDRAINLLDAESLGDESRIRNAQEALDFYVPLSVLVGLMKAARHLSDVAFKALYPNQHAAIQSTIKEVYNKNNQLILDLIKTIKTLYLESLLSSLPLRSMRANQFNYSSYFTRLFRIFSKSRTPYEIFQITTMKNAEIKNFSDIIMIQITVETEQDCYQVINLIHGLGLPMDRYWHDYIKDPKIGGYQSLHTAITYNGILIRFQIRTQQMQGVAQEGVLHGAYTAGGKFIQPNLPWLNNDWLRLILTVMDRRDKILLTKSLAQARLADIIVDNEKGQRINHLRDVLLPRGISPLEAAIIADPQTGIHLVNAFHYDISKPIDQPISEGIGVIVLHLSNEIQYRDYNSLLKNPLARYKFYEYIQTQSLEFKHKLGKGILAKSLAGIYINADNFSSEDSIIFLDSLADQMFDSKLSAEEIAGNLKNSLKNPNGSPIKTVKLELEESSNIDEIINKLFDLFPIESYQRKNGKIIIDIPIYCNFQSIQLDNFLKKYDRIMQYAS